MEAAFWAEQLALARERAPSTGMSSDDFGHPPLDAARRRRPPPLIRATPAPLVPRRTDPHGLPASDRPPCARQRRRRLARRRRPDDAIDFNTGRCNIHGAVAHTTETVISAFASGSDTPTLDHVVDADGSRRGAHTYALPFGRSGHVHIVAAGTVGQPARLLAVQRGPEPSIAPGLMEALANRRM